MDIESDDSERWEDFFGSSTDLTPSLIGLYDTLTGSLSATAHSTAEENNDHSQSQSQSQSQSESQLSQQQNHQQLPSSVKGEEIVADRKTHLWSDSANLKAVSVSHTANTKHRSFRVLSPNVQRLLSHSSATVVGDIESAAIAAAEPIQCNSVANNGPLNVSTTVNNCNRSFRKIAGKHKLSHIPLSRNICKLTQAGNELVETFETSIQSSSESLDRLPVSTTISSFLPGITLKEEQSDSHQTPINKSENNFEFNLKDANYVTNIDLAKEKRNPEIEVEAPVSIQINGVSILDKRKKALATSTNRLIEIAKKKFYPCEETSQISTANHISPIKSQKCHSPAKQNQDSQLDALGGEGSPIDNNPPVKDSFSSEQITGNLNLTTANRRQSLELNETVECVNKMSVEDKSSIKKCTPPSSPLLTYARVKVLAGSKPGISPQRISRKLSAENLDKLTDMKPLSISTLSPKTNRKSTLILPDVAKLKHRPLSSSSICSTSSSSSSGSENLLNGKLGVSYLASVESLADQSENELLDGHSNLTVFERSCLEIIDSEKSYVEDLRQIISGYFEDWKERACLKLDELKILFSNIQDIYNFNSILLKQLINSGMDPVKIAKCFIGLKDHFDVYTTYCTSYPEAISLLTSLLQASHTNALLTSTQKMLQHTLPLGSYLLKPVQRILKYHLLLDNLRKHCDIEEVVQAHDIMRQVARNIDQVKKKLEQQSRVKELSGILDGWLGPELTVLGELRQEGLLMENNKPRIVFLFQTMLIITKQKEDNRLQFKSYIYRNNLMLREHLPGEPTSFNVIPYDEPRNQIKLTAKNRDQKRMWAQNIKGVILEQFDIPNRAKELVYKLGDEEDRTPDKNMWKWNFTSSTPIYLERRNQYRRSEIRNRSKTKRKTITNSTSFEGFLDKKEAVVDKRHLLRKQSIDDTIISMLKKKCKHNNNDEGICDCSLTKANTLNNKTGSVAMKERSKSVPRISASHNGDSDEECFMKTDITFKKEKSTESMISRATSTLGRTISTKPVDVKVYTTKSIPKRIANLKKSRQKKETSTFYMDLNDFEDTVLKITESSENLTISGDKSCEGTNSIKEKHLIENGEVEKSENENRENNDKEKQNRQENQTVDAQEKLKNDVEIISELLKDKGFDRILKKPPKKRSFDNGQLLSSPELLNTKDADMKPPPPPSYSPPPLNAEDDEENTVNTSKSDNKDPEPIYESLLRNVHVPYKFSPILNRSKSQQYYTSTFNELKLSMTPARPESDYVTLVYKENGDLHTIDNAIVKRIISTDVLRNSDSNINYESVTETETNNNISTCQSPSTFSSEIDLQEENSLAMKSSKTLAQRFIGPKNENVSTSENSLLPRVRKSVDNISLEFGRTNKPPERRVSDVTEMCRQSIIHRQGSEAVGERIANLDYADPRTLFSSSMNSSAISLNPQRDSVFSLTSSNDSVCDSKSKVSQTENSSFIYEDNVEACLENDFRDSAVYSDDNEKRQDSFENPSENIKVKRPTSPPPPPPPPRKAVSSTTITTAARTLLSPSSTPNGTMPPPIPSKPNLPSLKRLNSGTVSTTCESKSPEIVISSKENELIGSGKSWVLQQIENFNK